MDVFLLFLLIKSLGKFQIPLLSGVLLRICGSVIYGDETFFQWWLSVRVAHKILTLAVNVRII